MTIVSSDVFRRVLESNWPHTDSENRLQVRSPDGYLFTVENSASNGSRTNQLLDIVSQISWCGQQACVFHVASQLMFRSYVLWMTFPLYFCLPL